MPERPPMPEPTLMSAGGLDQAVANTLAGHTKDYPGINPNDVPVPSDITIDGGATVTVETHLRHPDGSLTGTKDDWGNLVDRTTTTTTVPLVEPWPLTREV